jgi:hypothetical protein
MEKKNMGSMLTKTAKIFYLSIVALIFGAGISIAQVEAPKNLRATPIGDNKILLQWDKPAGDVSNFKIYRTKDIDTTFLEFLDNVPGTITTYIDKILDNDFKYRYYICAVYGFEVSQKVYTFAKAIAGKNTIQFSSSPNTRGKVGVLYTYKPAAVGLNLNPKYSYTLIDPPANMVIRDSLLGEIDWVPTKADRYPVKICAKDLNDSSYLKYGIPIQSIQSFEVLVTSDAGTIQGYVKDAEKGIQGVSLRLYELNNDKYTYDVTTDNYGYYNIPKISNGDYYIYLKAPEPYISIWYNGANDFKSAERVTINKFLQKDFQLSKKTEQWATIRGVVKDTFGTPIHHAPVWIIDANGYLNIGKDDKGLDSYINEIQSGITVYWDTTFYDGTFKINVPKNKFYFVVVDLSTYYTIYYKNQSNLIYANKLYVNSNKDSIDFFLLPKILSENKIDLKVIKSDDNEGIKSRIIFLKKEQRGANGGGRVPFKFAPVDLFKTYTTDINGNFSVTGEIDTSMYYIQAIPYGSYIPTLYRGSSKESNIKWSLADSINISGAVTGLVLKTSPSITDGLGSISGKIKSQSGENVYGAMVYAVVSDLMGEKVVGYGITDSLGYYIIKGLRTGVYLLHIEHYDYESPTNKEFEINYNNPTTEMVEIIINPIITSIVSIPIDPTPAKEYALRQNYPNPFNPSTTIEYSLTNRARVDIKIYDVLGREVFSLLNEDKNAGTYRVIFNAKNHSSGFYFAVIKVYQKDRLIFFDKKKMLLIK